MSQRHVSDVSSDSRVGSGFVLDVDTGSQFRPGPQTGRALSPARLVSSAASHNRAVGIWLLVCCAAVFIMAVVGGITRLTGSGLSMVEWRPLIGWVPPLSDAEWQRVFSLYRQTPEYQHINMGLSLEGFKRIFFWEWLHRLWGRVNGLIFLLPLVVFALRRRLPRGILPRLLGLLVLGGAQGFAGWFMVKSGLVDRPWVSHYRLALHLGLALLIYSFMFWIALGQLRPERPRPERWALSGHASWVLGSLTLTILWGAFVAGMDAGLVYNTYPLMEGRWLAPEVGATTPVFLDPVANMVTVQFVHRHLGLLTTLLVASLWLRARRLPLVKWHRWVLLALPFTVLTQLGLGIGTLLLRVPVSLGVIHQAVAVVLLTAVLLARHVLQGYPAASRERSTGLDLAEPAEANG